MPNLFSIEANCLVCDFVLTTSASSFYIRMTPLLFNSTY
ncbi:unnamed protein product [Amoebophrya sp. A25]|nr:unnamed protein product [Amoebophrya sp. A25]|eukprot:GSA25T00002961001.1